MSNEHNIYEFEHKEHIFEVDDKNLTMVKDGKKLNLTRQQFEILLKFLKSPNTLITRTNFSNEIWEGAGMSDATLNKEISLIRKEFGDKNEIISTVSKSRNNQKSDGEGGYKFNLQVETKKAKTISDNETEAKKESDIYFNEPELKPIAQNHANYSEPVSNAEDFKFRAYFSLKSKPMLIFIAVIAFLIIGIIGSRLFLDNDEEKIRQLAEESQLFETLVLYKKPSSFSEASLDKYWTAELDINSNYDRQRIRDSVNGLIQKGNRYGDETKCERFEFQSVEINQDNDFAIVKTLEKWFISVYSADGNLIENKQVGPYFVSYFVRKVEGRWLIEKSNTARVIRPTPQLSEVKALTEIKSKREFFIKIIGQDFEPGTVYIEVVGTGCPENDPCKIPNTALMEKSKLSETILDNVPFTLASGDFTITVHNGESKASNSIKISVP